MVMVPLAAAVIFLFMAFQVQPRRPVQHWLAGSVLLSVGYALRALPDPEQLREWFWLAGVMFLAGNLLLWTGLYSFCGRRRRIRPRHLTVLSALIWLAGQTLPYPHQLTLMFLLTGAISLFCFWTIYRAEHLGSPLLRQFVAWIFLCHGLLSLLRMLLAYAGNFWQFAIDMHQLSAIGLLPTAALTIMRFYGLLLLIHIRQQRDLEQLSVTDSLTGVYNRKGFLHQAQRLLDRQQPTDRPYAVLMLDLDHFKQVNDQHGHAAGDAVLRHFATLLRAQLRPGDCSGRLGGEEFAALLLGVEHNTAVIIAERLRQRLQDLPVGIGDRSLSVTVSIGVHHSEEPTADIEPMLQKADQALYTAKANGRNRVQSMQATLH